MTTTHTGTETYTTTVSAADVRVVMQQVGLDIQAVCRAAAHAASRFDVDAALTDVSILVLNGVIKAVSLQIHKDGVLVREYAFRLEDAPSGASGPPAGQPPLGYVPDGARVRLTATPDMRLPEPERRAWFDRLGWSPAAPLASPEGASHQAYGVFQSGGLSVTRHVMTNPRYDR